MITLWRNIVVLILIQLWIYNSVWAKIGKEDIIPRWNSITPAGALPSWTGFLDGLAEYIKESIFGIMVLIIIWMFLFIGFRLIIARGQPEEFGKAMKSLVYVIVWIFVVSIAWLAVRLISWLNIN